VRFFEGGADGLHLYQTTSGVQCLVSKIKLPIHLGGKHETKISGLQLIHGNLCYISRLLRHNEHIGSSGSSISSSWLLLGITDDWID
jgi:hypothetical protein